jgi:hypothetical protein
MLMRASALAEKTPPCIPHFFFEGQSNSPDQAFGRNLMKSAMADFMGQGPRLCNEYFDLSHRLLYSLLSVFNGVDNNVFYHRGDSAEDRGT